MNSMRTIAAAAVLCVAGLTAGATPQYVGDVSSHPGWVLVSVIDSSGAPVRGLTAGDFAVRVDGVEATIVSAVPAVSPASIVVIPSGFSRNWVPGVRELMRAVIGAAQTDFRDARIGVMIGDGAAPPVMRDAAAEALHGEVSTYVGLVNTPLLDSLLVASEKLSREPIDRRRVIIAATVHGSADDDGLVPSRIARAVRESGASLWVLDFGGQLALGSSVGQVLDQVPIASGGRRMTSSLTVMTAQAKQIVATIASQYVVTYDAERVTGTSTVRVGVRRDDVVVLAPNWR